MNRRELEERILNLEKVVKKEEKEESFDLLKLIKNKYTIETYEKLGTKYYFLIKKDYISMWSFTFNYWGVDRAENCSNKKKSISPEFTNIQELYMWIIENYKKLNSANEKKKAGRPKKTIRK